MRQYIVPRLLANEIRKFQNLKCRLKWRSPAAGHLWKLNTSDTTSESRGGWGLYRYRSHMFFFMLITFAWSRGRYSNTRPLGRVFKHRPILFSASWAWTPSPRRKFLEMRMYHKIPSIRYSYSFLVGVHTWILNLSVNLGSVVHGILYMEFILDRLPIHFNLCHRNHGYWLPCK